MEEWVVNKCPSPPRLSLNPLVLIKFEIFSIVGEELLGWAVATPFAIRIHRFNTFDDLWSVTT